ncbi:dATP/dGTP diphosphohydrolase domain-containing protein [Aurantimonas coralicida]|uniref:dATP/dGTP diphosphohydrolase domain-containing protein n=1 Tax=Aurantimonas coralicida TaxID=182270 RepID=UPI001D18636A|nr:dATP/dGTP diphosphohydrolase domain-containing protein [Aurantimonas coralicida]MCC4298461.1 DUF5664 domain-containing protein [Aurantimonas coralicida]
MSVVENPKQAIGRRKAPQMSVVPATALAWLAEALRNGAIEKVYGIKNWRESEVCLTDYLDAASRHLMAMQEGEDVADDSLALHAAHLMATCAIIIDADACGTLRDDRVLGRPDVFAQVQADILARRAAFEERRAA